MTGVQVTFMIVLAIFRQIAVIIFAQNMDTMQPHSKYIHDSKDLHQRGK